MKLAQTIASTSLALLLSTTGALAATANSVDAMQNGSPVALTGTVENFTSAKSFTLRDASGTVEIDLSSTPSIVLKNGDKVDVSGTVDKGVLGAKIVATTVDEDKNVGQQIGEAIDSVTGQNQASNATPVSIKTLPTSGLVKIQGTVASVSNAKKFTLKDSTGTIDVAIQSSQSASLQKGTPVTVVGYVDNGLFSKSINATQVEVQSP
jgi:uncharacterized protein YdeI (BOF family)